MNLVRASYGFQRYLRDWIVSPCRLFQFVHRLKKKKKKNASRLRPGVRGTSRGRVSHGVTVLFQNRCRDTASSAGSRYSRYLGQAFGLVKQPLRGINPLLFRKIPPPPPYDIDQLSKQSLSGRGIHFRSRNNISIMSRDIFVVSSNFRPEGELVQRVVWTKAVELLIVAVSRNRGGREALFAAVLRVGDDEGAYTCTFRICGSIIAIGTRIKSRGLSCPDNASSGCTQL